MNAIPEYPKIPSPFKRYTEGPKRNQFTDEWTAPELEHLARLPWLWTEKVDGTNIRVHWDGHRVSFGGRTDNAQIPTKLLTVLTDLAPEELFEQTFNDQAVTLFGEGYGAGIQAGGVYRPDMSFVLFDVRVGLWWLRRHDTEDVAKRMGLDVVPIVHTGPIAEAIQLVRAGVRSDWDPQREAEGLVGVTPDGLLDRSGHRLIVKVKAKDFPPDRAS
jgi:hypothetical protein